MKDPWDDLTQSVKETEDLLNHLKARLREVMEVEQEQILLQQQLRELTPELKTEIAQITERLAEIEVTLESRLFNWGSLKEPFWQMVRFMGLGILIGVLLQRCAG